MYYATAGAQTTSQQQPSSRGASTGQLPAGFPSVGVARGGPGPPGFSSRTAGGTTFAPSSRNIWLMWFSLQIQANFLHSEVDLHMRRKLNNRECSCRNLKDHCREEYNRLDRLLGYQHQEQQEDKDKARRMDCVKKIPEGVETNSRH